MTLAFLTACGNSDPNPSIDEGIGEHNVYTSSEIDWSIKIPDGWAVVSKDRLEDLDKMGLEAIENVVDGQVDYSGLKHLIGFSKNEFNMFQSTIEPFELEYPGEWEENNVALKALVLTALKEKGIRAEASEISNESIKGLDFQKYEITIYDHRDQVILNLLMYSRLINGFDFAINISSNNPNHKNTMLKTWKNSHFAVGSEE